MQKHKNVDSQLNYAEWANNNMEITIQIESVKGYENLKGILKEKGFIGLLLDQFVRPWISRPTRA